MESPCTKCGGTGRYVYTHTWTDGQPVAQTFYCDQCPQGPVAESQDFPPQYPKCTNDPPMGPEVQCGNENCNYHNILWLEQSGANHRQAIVLAAVYSFSESWGYGPVADALGGMDQFNELNENGADVPGLAAWVDQHYPLVYYIMETHEKNRLWDYWWQAAHPHHHIPERGRVGIHLIKGPDGQWQPFQAPGQPLVVQNGYDAWAANWDATMAVMSTEQKENHTIGWFEFETP